MALVFKRSAFATLCVIAALVSWQAGTQARQATELDGLWDGVRSTVGEATRTFKPGELSLAFNGSALEAVGLLGSQASKLQVVIDPKKKHLSYPRKPGEIVECLYQLDGDSLILAVPRASTVRPQNMSPTSTDSVLLYLKRRR